MIFWTIKFPKYFDLTNILLLNLNTLTLVIFTSIVLISFSFLINFGNRISKSKILNYLSFFSISGYAIPGVILAVAFITFFSWFSDFFSSFFSTLVLKKFLLVQC